jgi:hypothetical protein
MSSMSKRSLTCLLPGVQQANPGHVWLLKGLVQCEQHSIKYLAEHQGVLAVHDPAAAYVQGPEKLAGLYSTTRTCEL